MGATRYNLFTDGKLKIDRFTDAQFEPIRLDVLKKQNAVGFSRAGVTLDENGRPVTPSTPKTPPKAKKAVIPKRDVAFKYEELPDYEDSPHISNSKTRVVVRMDTATPKQAEKAQAMGKATAGSMQHYSKGIGERDEIKVKAWSNGNIETEYTIFDKSNNELLNMQRISDGVTMQHSYLKLDTQFQGTGIVKQTFGDSFREYQKQGLKNVAVSANINRGGYVWMKFGFTPKNAKVFHESMAYHLDDILPLVSKDKSLVARIQGDNEKAFQSYVKGDTTALMKWAQKGDEEYKKDMADSLDGFSWSGSIDLTNDKHMKSVFKYLDE